MKLNKIDRSNFIRQSLFLGAGSVLPRAIFEGRELVAGIVGLSPHSMAFSQFLNDEKKSGDLDGLRIAALFHPPGNPDVEFSDEQLKEYATAVRAAGVVIVNSMDELLSNVDVVLIETNDGRPHLEQIEPILKAKKPVFLDKPVGQDLPTVIKIFEAAEAYGVPIFSSSSLRFKANAQEIDQGMSDKKVMGADVFSPAPLQPAHTDLFWYGIHGVEMLYTVMGPGCKEVWQVKHSEDEDIVCGAWYDGRIGTFRGTRYGKYDYGGSVFTDKGVIALGGFEGYRPLVVKIVEFFRTNRSPVPVEETLEIYAFMTAAQMSKESSGRKISLQGLLESSSGE